MPIITLLTDFGTRDPYVGVMKGVISSVAPGVSTIDITHEVGPQDIQEGAFLLPEYYPFFPAGTIHLAVIDPTVGSARLPLVLSAKDHFFVGPDNGLFTLVFEQGGWEAFVIENRDLVSGEIGSTFHGRDIFAPAAAHLAAGVKPSEFGRKLGTPVLLENVHPRVLHDMLYGEIVRFDRFGNAISNIRKDVLDGFLRERTFRITLGSLAFERIGKAYYEGDVNCVVGSSGYLEFALFKGSLRDEKGVWKGDEVKILAR